MPFGQLPAGVQALASSPLMLGLLRSLPEDRIRTASEDSVLSGYVGASSHDRFSEAATWRTR